MQKWEEAARYFGIVLARKKRSIMSTVTMIQRTVPKYFQGEVSLYDVSTL